MDRWSEGLGLEELWPEQLWSEELGLEEPWSEEPWSEEPWSENALEDSALSWGDSEGWPGLGGVLQEVIHPELAGGLDAQDYDDAMEAVLGSVSAAEAFNIAKALRQIGGGAGQVLANPAVSQIARTALPTATGALGTVIGGPVGTALGTRLGSLAAGALTRQGAPRPAAPITTATASPAATPVAGGSAAAAQGLVLTQQPDVLKALLALALGGNGSRQVGGVPVTSVMNMLSQVFGQAAADADELAHPGGWAADAEGGYLEGSHLEAGWPPDDLGSANPRSLYTALLDADNEELSS
ncbi:MAG: hypothetical protein JNL54_10355 [Kineosporiaceae bacterium]|nr:hypothetical protein [Kineosporiaceae bacterium]